MSYLEHKREAPRSVNCAILTTSDTRTEENDETGRLIRQKLSQNGHRVISYSVIKNEADTIKRKISELLGNEEIQVIITSGGTGLSHRDVTIDAIVPMLQKTLYGFGELFRSLSNQEIGTASIMSRALAGVTGEKVILCIPGSPGAVELAMDRIILAEIGHLVREATR